MPNPYTFVQVVIRRQPLMSLVLPEIICVSAQWLEQISFFNLTEKSYRTCCNMQNELKNFKIEKKNNACTDLSQRKIGIPT